MKVIIQIEVECDYSPIHMNRTSMMDMIKTAAKRAAASIPTNSIMHNMEVQNWAILEILKKQK